MVQHFGTAVYVWDVVNEPLDPKISSLYGGTASASFTVQLQRCSDDARFVLWAPWSANVYETGTVVAKDLQP